MLTYVLFVTCWVSLALALLAPWVVRLLTSRPATVARVVDAMVHRVVESVGWNMTNVVIRLIREHSGHVTTAHVELLEEALKTNVEVERAFDALPVIEELRSIVDTR